MILSKNKNLIIYKLEFKNLMVFYLFSDTFATRPDILEHIFDGETFCPLFHILNQVLILREFIFNLFNLTLFKKLSYIIRL